MSVHVFTSITANYLPKARVLAYSVKRFLPGSIFHLQLADSAPEGFDLAAEPFDCLMSVDDLGIVNAEQWLFKHSVVEACTGIKGFGLKKILAIPDCSCVFYFDPDMVLLASPSKLLDRCSKGDVILTPHLTQPEVDLEAILDNEFSVLKHGVYNLGFLGVCNTPEGRRFAEWWASRLDRFCYDDIPSGLFTDQRWVDLAPAYFAGIEILRDPGYNVATWNLTHRPVHGNLRDGFTAGGEPLCLYHFSGLDSGDQLLMLEKYGATMPALYELRDWYLAECDRMGQGKTRNIPWVYDFFENGERVTPLHRKRYRERQDLQDAFPNPFSTADVNGSYYHWFAANDETRKKSVLPVLPSAPSEPPRDWETSADSESTPDHDYCVCISVCESDVQRAKIALADFWEKTFRKDRLYVVGSGSVIFELREECNVNPVQWIEMRESASHEEAFGAVLRSYAITSDLIWVTSATVVPELWDLRLAWTAERIGGAGTVSPISDRGAATRLGVSQWHHSVSSLDQGCYEHTEFLNPDIPEFCPDCSLLIREAIREIASLGPNLTFQKASERLRQLRWPQVLADHIYVAYAGEAAASSADLPAEPLSALKTRLDNHFSAELTAPRTAPLRKLWRRRQLHVMHSWGGGLENWVREYCQADLDHENFVLKSVGNWGAFGQELHLYRRLGDLVPLEVWRLAPVVRHTGIAHSGYRAALTELIEVYGIDAIVVSSLIGHSVDVLDTGLPTIMVCHDYYPFCPALNITFESVCRSCTATDLARCTEANPHNRFFRNVPPSEWIGLRKEFAAVVLRRQVPLIAPSPSVRSHYLDFLPELSGVFKIVPHGVRPLEPVSPGIPRGTGGRLRVVLLGSLAPHKGLELFRAITAELRSFADLFLLGCGDYGQEFASFPEVTIVSRYEREQLAALVQSVQPDVGLLLSTVPETFSYTLQECMNLGIPPIATRLGSFADAVQDGVNGFLADPVPEAVLARLREVDSNRALLQPVRNRLNTRTPRVPADMVADYERLLRVPGLSGRAYFALKGGLPRHSVVTRGFQVLWCTRGNGFSEDASRRKDIRITGAIQRVEIKLPAMDSAPTQIRVDLGDQPGFMRLLRVELLSSSGDRVWGWKSGEGAMEGVISGIQIVGGGGYGSLLYLLDNDPHWILPIGSGLDVLIGGGALTIEFCYPTLNEVASQDPSSAGRQRDGEVASGQLLNQLLEARTRIADLERSISWRITGPLRAAWASLRRGSHPT